MGDIDMDQTTYAELRGIDVSNYVESKNGLSYLSWAWAVDQMLSRDPKATWEFQMFDGKPYMQVFETWMVFCTVHAFGVSRTIQLPIIDYKNKPIPFPNAMDLNTSMMRALAKAISLHGIGINIYAGEDLPLSLSDAAVGYGNDMDGAKDMAELEEIVSHVKEFVGQYPKFRSNLIAQFDRNKARLSGMKVVSSDKAATGVAALKNALVSKQAQE